MPTNPSFSAPPPRASASLPRPSAGAPLWPQNVVPPDAAQPPNPAVPRGPLGASPALPPRPQMLWRPGPQPAHLPSAGGPAPAKTAPQAGLTQGCRPAGRAQPAAAPHVLLSAHLFAPLLAQAKPVQLGPFAEALAHGDRKQAWTQICAAALAGVPVHFYQWRQLVGLFFAANDVATLTSLAAQVAIPRVHQQLACALYDAQLMYFATHKDVAGLRGVWQSLRDEGLCGVEMLNAALRAAAKLGDAALGEHIVRQCKAQKMLGNEETFLLRLQLMGAGAPLLSGPMTGWQADLVLAASAAVGPALVQELVTRAVPYHLTSRMQTWYRSLGRPFTPEILCILAEGYLEEGSVHRAKSLLEKNKQRFDKTPLCYQVALRYARLREACERALAAKSAAKVRQKCLRVAT